MKRYRCLFFGLCLLLSLSVPALAQSYRLNSLSEQLATQASDVAERSYTDYSNKSYTNRTDVETLYRAQQFSASANVFRRMVRDSRRELELRDAWIILSSLARQASVNSAIRFQWNDVLRTLEDIRRELGLGGSPGGGGGGGGGDDVGRTTGRVRWRGTVDNDVHLVIRDDRIEVRTIGGSPYDNATYNFTSPLPRRRVNVSVVRLRGRGDVRVIRQPSRENDFTAVVQIRDSGGGAREYEIEVTW